MRGSTRAAGQPGSEPSESIEHTGVFRVFNSLWVERQDGAADSHGGRVEWGGVYNLRFLPPGHPEDHLKNGSVDQGHEKKCHSGWLSLKS